ncbi:MAG: TAXI family TRAP transporter solute-binding subunit [Vulcanimicrobiota bacterium]
MLKLKVYLPGILLAIAALVVAWQYVEPAPPDSIRLAVGPQDSSYYWLGQRYQEVLKQQGLSVELVESEGSRENLELIRGGQADAAFVQSGVSLGKEQSDGFFFLASLFPEPLWVFTRGKESRDQLLDLEGQKLGIGNPGSGSHFLAGSILTGMGLDQKNRLVEDNRPDSLRSGTIDFLFLLGSPNSPEVRALLEDDSLQLVGLRRAPGIAKHFESISFLTLPEGSVDLAGNLPSHTVSLLASTATLVVGPDFHPALTGVLLGAAQEIHGQPGALQERGQYPTAEFGSFPMTAEAAYFHENGPGFLQGKLPYKVAATLERLVILLIPLLTVILPLSKILPAIFAWRLNRRLHQPYKELLRLENQVGQEDFPEQLTEVESQARALHDMPPSYGAEVSNLLSHVERLKRRHAEEAGPK